MIQLALIPPYSMLHHTVTRELQMMLPAGLTNEMYRRHYKYLCAHPGCYVILDNGMFEGGSLSDIELLQRAKDYKVDEIVMPDVRGDSAGTLEVMRDFFRLYRQVYGMSSRAPNVMAVVQGQDSKQAKEHVVRFMDSWVADTARGHITLGIPRRLSEDSNQRHVRIDVVEFIADTYGNAMPIHLLGLSRANPKELQYIGRHFGQYVRGVDTSAPYVWASQNKHLDAGDIADREEDYFTLHPSRMQSPLVKHNTETLERWCRGE